MNDYNKHVKTIMSAIQEQQQLPMELYNHLITFRPMHPVAKLIQDFKQMFSYCIVCREKERVQTMECCSSDCYRQFVDDNYHEYGFKGEQFGCFMVDDAM